MVKTLEILAITMLGISNFTSMTLHIPNFDSEYVSYMQDESCKDVFQGKFCPEISVVFV